MDSAGNARPAGGMCATLRDIAGIGHLVLHGDNDVVPASWIDDILNNGSQEAFNAGAWRGFNKIFGNLVYRSGWLANSESKVLMAIGVHGQMLFADRKNGIVMAKTSSQPERVDSMKTALTALAFREFKRLLTERHTGGASSTIENNGNANSGGI